MRLVSVEQMRAIEREADQAGMSYAQMVQNAGRSLAEIVLDRYGAGGPLRAMALVGGGNNGADSLVALAYLASRGWRCTAYVAGKRAVEDALIRELEERGGLVVWGEADSGRVYLRSLLASSDLLIDGVLGTGAKLPLRDDVAEVLRIANLYAPRLTVVAVDCPSGVDCTSGEVAEETIRADLTVCMAAVKVGLVKLPAFADVGELVCTDIGLTDELKSWAEVGDEVADAEMVRAALPARPLDAHKGSFGTAMLVAGSVNYTGAVLLASRAAYLVGAGLVRVGVPAPLHAVLAGQLPEATWLLLPDDQGVIAEGAERVVLEDLKRASALLLGPGWGTETTTGRFLAAVLAEGSGRSLRRPVGFVQREENGEAGARVHLPPLVMDADGLRLLAQMESWPELLPPGSVLTPHPGEMSALCGLAVAEIQKDRIETARRFAQEWGHVVVLKGALTVVADPTGRVSVVPVATPALARAGTGDVLAGMTVGLLAQGMPAFEAARSAAWLHAQAGVLAKIARGTASSVLASDVAGRIPEVLAELGV
jgi:NAD(P)H-hydrate epimerase